MVDALVFGTHTAKVNLSQSHKFNGKFVVVVVAIVAATTITVTSTITTIAASVVAIAVVGVGVVVVVVTAIVRSNRNSQVLFANNVARTFISLQSSR